MGTARTVVVGGEFPYVPSARRYPCADCGADTYVTGHEDVVEAGASVICGQCALRDHLSEAGNVRISDETLQVVSEYFGRPVSREELLGAFEEALEEERRRWRGTP